MAKFVKELGRTENGKIVVSGVFYFYETHGLPLDVIFQLLNDRAYVPCWITFCRDANAAGVKHDRIISMLEPAITDSYGTDFCHNVTSILDALYKKGILYCTVDMLEDCPECYALIYPGEGVCRACIREFEREKKEQ